MNHGDDRFRRFEHFLVRLTLLLLLLLGMVRILLPEIREAYSSLRHGPPARAATAP